MKSFLVYKFTCASCSSNYISETCRHLKTRIEEHSTATYFDSYKSPCFKIIVKANSKFDLKIKEALHINWRKPNLNAEQNHLALPFHYSFCPPLFFSVFLYFFFFIGGVYCHNYASLLLHLVTTHLLSHTFLSTIISIISTLIIGIFYRLNYILLLLHLIITYLVIHFIITV